MPKQASQTIRNTFVKGLLTENSELSFPDDASVDECNCTLEKAGNRSRRLGLQPETAGVVSSEQYGENTLFTTDTWKNVGKDPSETYLVVQTGASLRFYRKGVSPLSSGEVPVSNVDSNPYILDMTAFEVSGGEGAGASHVAVTSIEGVLIVASPQIETFYIERDNTDESFSTTQINFKIRDFRYFGDPDTRLTEEIGSNPANPVTVQSGRKYDTQNTGWKGDKGEAALVAYTAANTAYPPLTHPWYSGKDSNGDFDVSEWEKIYAGTTLSVNGRFIIDLYDPVRLVGGLPIEKYDGSPILNPTERFNTVATYAGRAWYAGEGSNIYYSQIVTDIELLGNCYQQNDPTSEELSDLLATDGGVINIPEANGVRKIHVFGSSLLVFARNGVWRISGIDGNQFDTTGFSVYKITDFGLAFRESFVAGQNAVPFWWSTNGIHTVQVTDQGGIVEVNISRDTIQTFFNSIGAEQRGQVTGEYDAINNRIAWLYPDINEIIANKKTNILWLDADLGAFYPWKLSDGVVNSNYPIGLFYFDGEGSTDVDFTVIDSNGDTVVDTNGDTVIVTRTAGNLSSSALIILYLDDNGGLGFAEFTNSKFYDWGDGNYEAYAESAYNFMGDLGRRKNAPYITVFMRETETGWELENNTFNPSRPSSLGVTAYWDFRKNSFTGSQEAYRHKQPIVVDPNDLLNYDSPTTVLATRLKIRGRGRIMRLRFEASEGKDFNLLGWETLDAANSSY